MKAAVALLAVASQACAFSPANSTANGNNSDDLVRLVVGGSLEFTNDDVLDHYRGFPAGSVKYITAAGANAQGDATSIGRFFANAGIQAEWIDIYARNCATKAFDPEYVRMVEEASAIYMSGGQSWRVQQCLFGDSTTARDTPFLDAMRRKKIIGGSSAGAMNQPAVEMLVTGSSAESYDATRAGSIAHRENGNGFLFPSDEVVDVHFAERGRQGRLVVFAAEVGRKWAFGADENTAYRWTPEGVYEVIGQNGVAIFQDSERTGQYTQRSLMHFLTRGDKFNINTGEIVFSDDKNRCLSTEQPTPSNSVFSGVNYRDISIAVAKASAPTRLTNLHGNPAVFVTMDNAQAEAFCGTQQNGVLTESFRNLVIEQGRPSTEITDNYQKLEVDQDFIWPVDA